MVKEKKRPSVAEKIKETAKRLVKLGDEIIVKALGTDKKGRQNFSRKDALPKPKKKEKEVKSEETEVVEETTEVVED